MDRRSFLAQSVGTAAGIAVMGAAGELIVPSGAAGALTNGRGHNGISTMKPKRGGSLIFGVDAEESGFNPSKAKFDEVGIMYARTVFDPLAIIDTAGNWKPYLAKSITPNATYTAWTITLRTGVVFHDGAKCDGAALLLNFETQLSSLLTGIVWKPIVTSIKQTGPMAVTLTFKKPWIPFPYYLAGGIGAQAAFIMAPAMIHSKTAGTDNPIGTGPFKFTAWYPNTHFTAVANEKYWRKGLPYLDRITFKPIPDSTTRTEALQSGTIDMMITDTAQNITKYRGNSKWSYIDDSGNVVGEPTMNCLLLNLAIPPFTNPKVRLAAAKTINRPLYAKTIDKKIDPVSDGLFVKGTPYYSKTDYPSHDPAGAKRLVSEVKKAGGSVSFKLGSTTDPISKDEATFLAQEFKGVGFDVTRVVVEQNKLIDNALTGEFQCYTWRQFGAVNPDLNYIFWSTTTIYSRTGLSINMARNDDSQVEQALQVGRTSHNADARTAAYKKINQLFAKDLPYLWLDRAVWAIVAHPDVQNFNNPTTLTGGKAAGMVNGSIWPTQIWKA